MRRLAWIFLLVAWGCGAPAFGQEIQAAWLGTAGLFVSDGASAVLIDPFVSRKSFFTVVFGRILAPDPALERHWADKLHMPKGLPVFVSHSHFDHILDAPGFAAALDGRLVGSASTRRIGKAAGLREGQLETVASGATTPAGAFRVRTLGSCHPPTAFGYLAYSGEVDEAVKLPASASAFRVGDTFSFVLEHPRGTVLHHASPCTVPGMFKDVKADVVFLGISGREGTKELLKDVVDAVGAKVVVPIHYDNFFEALDMPLSSLPGSDLDEFLATARKERPNVVFETMPVGELKRVLPLDAGKPSN